ncbi:hypothetical protein D3C85_1737010 [compost metagenome]
MAMIVPMEEASNEMRKYRTKSNVGSCLAKSTKCAVIGAWIKFAVRETSTTMPTRESATASLFTRTPA